MTDETVFKKYSDSKKQENYWVERVKNQFAVAVERFADFRILKKKDLAERMNVSRPYITKILRGDANLTLETIARLAYVLDAEVTINLSPKESQIKPWLYALEGRPRSATAVGAVNSSGQEVTFPPNQRWGSQERK